MVSISENDISIEYRIKFTSTRNQIKRKKLGHLDEKTAKNGYLYEQFSQKLLFKVKTSFTRLSARSKKLLSLSENLFTKTAFLTFAFRSKCRVNKSSCKKNREKTNTPLRVVKKRQRPNTIQILWIVKNQEHRNIASLSLQLRSYNKNENNEYIAISLPWAHNFTAIIN